MFYFSDCGDISFWGENYYCRNHLPSQDSESDDKINEDMLNSCRVLFQGILEFCIKYSLPYHHDWSQMKFKSIKDSYVAVFYLDTLEDSNQKRIVSINWIR